jgi:hypothetical protein
VVGTSLLWSFFIRPAGTTPCGPHKAEQPTDPPGRCQSDFAAACTSRAGTSLSLCGSLKPQAWGWFPALATVCHRYDSQVYHPQTLRV